MDKTLVTMSNFPIKGNLFRLVSITSKGHRTRISLPGLFINRHELVSVYRWALNTL